MTQSILAEHGLVDKYIGDAIMAVYGAPLPMPDHASRACQTALRMLEALRALQPRWQERGLPMIEIGIGIHSGPMVVGNIGAEAHFSYTVIGDAVNLGARLESATKEYGVPIIVSEATWQQVRERFATRELDLIRVQGKEQHTRIFEVISALPLPPHRAASLHAFAAGLDAYRAGQWQEAMAFFQHALQIEPADYPSELYLQRCHTFLRTPPPDEWDGVHVMESK